MKKIFIFVVIMSLLCSNGMAQVKEVDFKIHPESYFSTDDDKDYVVIEFEGKTAEDLYKMVMDNVMTLYSDPKQVVSSSENSVIKIRAFNELIASKKTLMVPVLYGGYYHLVFRFKDGRVRIDAPIIEDELVATSQFMVSHNNMHIYLKDLLKKYFKDGAVREKYVDEVKIIEYTVNRPINYLLGNSKNSIPKEDDNW